MNKIFKNTFFNLLQAIIVAPIFFIIVPYTILKLGADNYGLYALVGVISSYQVFVEMGLTSTLVRFVAKANVEKQFKLIGEYLSTAAIVFTLLSGVALLIIYFASEIIVLKFLSITENIDSVVLLVRISAITGAVNLISGLFKSVLDGLQRMEISNIILTIQVICTAIGTYYVLEMGYGITGLVLNNLINSLLSLLANLAFGLKLIHFKFNIFNFSFDRFKEMFRFGLNLQLSSLLFFWNEPLNKVLISYFFGTTYVGYYDIALKFTSRIHNLLRSALSSLFPASAEIFEKSGYDGVERLRVKSLKYVYPIVIFIFAIAIMLTPSFVNLWLGNDFQIISFAIIIFFIGSAFTTIAIPTYSILLGSGFAQDTLKIQVKVFLVNILSILIFTPIFGFYGFCFGYTISMVYGFFETHLQYKRRFNAKTRMYKMYYDIKHIKLLITILAISVLFYFFINVTSWIVLILCGMLLLIILIITIWKLNIIEKNEIAILFGKGSLRT